MAMNEEKSEHKALLMSVSPKGCLVASIVGKRETSHIPEVVPARLKGFRGFLDNDDVMPVMLQELDQEIQRIARMPYIQLQSL